MTLPKYQVGDKVRVKAAALAEWKYDALYGGIVTVQEVRQKYRRYTDGYKDRHNGYLLTRSNNRPSGGHVWAEEELESAGTATRMQMPSDEAEDKYVVGYV